MQSSVPPGLPTNGTDCYINASLQALAALSSLRMALEGNLCLNQQNYLILASLKFLNRLEVNSDGHLKNHERLRNFFGLGKFGDSREVSLWILHSIKSNTMASEPADLFGMVENWRMCTNCTYQIKELSAEMNCVFSFHT
eukprot:Filipodium_phascolosomae@DN2593_c0_g1_i7.p1